MLVRIVKTKPILNGAERAVLDCWRYRCERFHPWLQTCAQENQETVGGYGQIIWWDHHRL